MCCHDLLMHIDPVDPEEKCKCTLYYNDICSVKSRLINSFSVVHLPVSHPSRFDFTSKVNIVQHVD